MNRVAGCAAFAILLVAQRLAAEERLHAALESITSPELKRHVEVLADDSFEGREAGSRGGRAAGGYIVEQLRKLGLKGGAAEGGFYQSFDGSSRNILAMLEGSDPELKKQVVIVSAHYDHVGYGNRQNSFGPFGRIHNGADDNASGVAGLLEILDGLSKMPERPKRSVMFAFWDGEEKGLLGSRYWVSQPTVPLERVPIMVNVDMIGRVRADRVEVYGSRTAPGLRRLLSVQNNGLGLRLDFTWELKDNSDHYPFYARGIPIVMLHSGLHGDYHRPSDDVERVNVEGLKQVSRLLAGFVIELANAEAIGRFRKASRDETPGKQQLIEYTLPQAPPRLGVRCAADDASGQGVRLSGVDARSAAAKAGLLTGDRVLKLGGRDIRTAAELQLAALASASPAEVVVQREGTEQPLVMKVELRGEPVRLGINWRTSEAEPAVVIVTRVMTGSAAEAAGLKAHDRIYSIADKPLANSNDFGVLVKTVEGSVPLVVERQGQVRTITMDVPPVLSAAPQQ